MEWIRYTHRSSEIDLSYLVECEEGLPLTYNFQGEECVHLQTIANMLYEPEGRHIPAFTYLPVAGFKEKYIENPE